MPSIEAPIDFLETGSEACSIQTTVTKIMVQENGGHQNNGLLLGGAIRYVRLFCLPRHSYVRATALRKQISACVRNIFKHVNILSRKQTKYCRKLTRESRLYTSGLSQSLGILLVPLCTAPLQGAAMWKIYQRGPNPIADLS